MRVYDVLAVIDTAFLAVTLVLVVTDFLIIGKRVGVHTGRSFFGVRSPSVRF